MTKGKKKGAEDPPPWVALNNQGMRRSSLSLRRDQKASQNRKRDKPIIVYGASPLLKEDKYG